MESSNSSKYGFWDYLLVFAVTLVTAIVMAFTEPLEARADVVQNVVQESQMPYVASQDEVELLAKLIYREMHGYLEQPSWYGLTKVQGYRAAIITGVVVRNRLCNNSNGWKTITDVIAAPNQYGPGGNASLQAIRSISAPPKIFYNISEEILHNNEQQLAEDLLGDDPSFNMMDFEIPYNVWYQSQYTALGSGTYAIIGNQYYNFK